MKIQPIKAFADNYIWVMENQAELIVVDPGEAKGVFHFLEGADVQKLTILLTHKHEDHVGGVAEIVEQYPGTTVYGPIETSDLADVVIKDGDQFEVSGQNFSVFKTAGHTEEHISYLTSDILFSGDALFSGGCGRVFTGDYEAQWHALEKFKALDDSVKVYAAHEYTKTNLTFAQSIEPENEEISAALAEVSKILSDNLPTYPTTIGREMKINLFLQAETLEEFIELRQARDQF